MVLDNVLVLATGTQIVKNEKGEPAPVDVYTLEVTPQEGEKLALAASERARERFSQRGGGTAGFNAGTGASVQW